MRAPTLGVAATQLPWLTPGATSLTAMARGPASAAWQLARLDPAAILLLLRRGRHPARVADTSLAATLQDPVPCEAAVELLASQHGAGFVPWNQPDLAPLLHAGWRYAQAAERFAEIASTCEPELAWVAGLLAPLGWYAVAAIAPEAAAACLADLAQDPDSDAVQQRHWGLEQAAIARRLLRRWQIPGPLAPVLGHFTLQADLALSLGCDRALLRVLQSSIRFVELHTRQPLHLLPRRRTADEISLSPVESAGLLDELDRIPPAADTLVWENPACQPLLTELLRLAAENRRLRDAPGLDALEEERDLICQKLQRQQGGQDERLRRLKLEALAELAGGAAHEINNPLAVISGQAQYLLGHLDQPAFQKSLQTIVGQTHRIHQVLSELMLFARPSRPQKQWCAAADLIREACLALSDAASSKEVQLLVPDPEPAERLFADPRLIGTALECLIRNAVQAASAGGHVRLALQVDAADQLEFSVEDTGPGPSPEHLEHLFDPFFSGRQAGRGRGLGLPTAWRLAREHGGDVRFEGDSPTRFVLRLPRGNSGENGHANGMHHAEAISSS